jgi:hypothetical protein
MQELLGYSDIKTTMIYAPMLNLGTLVIASNLTDDFLLPLAFRRPKRTRRG